MLRRGSQVLGKAAAKAAAAPAARGLFRQQRASFSSIYDNMTPYEVRYEAQASSLL